MPINENYEEGAVVKSIADALDDFYSRLIAKINELNIRDVMKHKNPYLFRAKAFHMASEIIDALISAIISSSEETIFGNVFFEPIALVASNGKKSLAEGIDVEVHTDDTIYAFAVKSGTSVFNADSKKRQEQNFNAAYKLAQQAKKRFVPIIGYGYGKKHLSGRGRARIYEEWAGQKFWYEISGDEDFYIKIIQFMEKLPEKYIEEFNEAYADASNRLVREFIESFCSEDGSIDWEKLVRFNSGI
jgi:hypothetical protein